MKRPSLTAFRSFLALAAVGVFAGCASDVQLTEPAPVETRTATAVAAATSNPRPGSGSATQTAPAPTGSAQSSIATVNLTQPANTSASSAQIARVVYFDFDSFVIKDEFKGLVEAHAQSLLAQTQRRVVVEGHTDERGSREYNLALGQKRAEAVAKSLSLLGVAAAQVEAVSFGEERPAVQASDEAAWAKNRRAELRDR